LPGKGKIKITDKKFEFDFAPENNEIELVITMGILPV
jgi:hypothetical protein